MIRFLTFFLLILPLVAKASIENARLSLLEDLAGEWVSRSIYTVTELGIPDLLNDGPKDDIELARLTQTHHESLFRVLRMLASRGIFQEHDHHYFSHSEKSKLLSKNLPSSLHSLTLFYGDLIHKSWDSLQNALHSGQPGFNEHFGQPVFRYFENHKRDFDLFHQAMREKSETVIESCLHTFDFHPFVSIFDIGGGKGHFLKAILNQYSHTTGVLFELPEVIDQLNQQIPLNKCQYISGDFFKAVPAGGDLYLLKSVLHDWNDQKAIKILSKCREAMHDQSRLLIIEPIIDSHASDYAKLMDVLMLNITGGKERTLADFTSLLQKSGFAIEEIYPTSTEFKMILAKKFR